MKRYKDNISNSNKHLNKWKFRKYYKYIDMKICSVKHRQVIIKSGGNSLENSLLKCQNKICLKFQIVW